MTDIFPAAEAALIPAVTPSRSIRKTNASAIADLIGASISSNTRRAYRGALERLDEWLDGRDRDHGSLASWISHLHARGLSASTASLAVAAACFHNMMLRFISYEPLAKFRHGGILCAAQ